MLFKDMSVLGKDRREALIAPQVTSCLAQTLYAGKVNYLLFGKLPLMGRVSVTVLWIGSRGHKFS